MRTYFDHEKLEVYQLELAHCKRRNWTSGSSSLRRDMLLHVQDQRRLRGSATECAARLDALVAKKLCSAEEVNEGKELLLRVVSILTKLIERFDQRLNEEEGSYGTEDE